MIKLLLPLLFLSIFPAEAKKKVVLPERHVPAKGEDKALTTLLGTLDPLSISEHLAFYRLYKDAPEGKEALAKAWKLLGGEQSIQSNGLDFPDIDINHIISLITRPSFETAPTLSEEHFALIDNLSSSLKNRALKGHKVSTRKKAFSLSDEETDLSRSLLLFQLGDDPQSLEKIRAYEAELDLITLQIRSKLKPNPSHQEILQAINTFIFYDMQFRFPPQSAHAADIDLYTFLPSVLDGRQGVCLGVSILYLSIAQRLGLPLEIITPPGHIYLRYRDGETLTNIETTARGIDTPSDMYLGINTRSLKQRPLKEVIGLAFMNQAAVYWSNQKYDKSLACYEEALPFMPKDPLITMFYAFSCLFNDKIKQGTALLKEVKKSDFKEAVSRETIPEDYLLGRTDAEGIKAVFLSVDETKESILKKRERLEKTLARYPKFRAGLLQLATTWLQLGRTKEAMEVLDRYHAIDSNNVIVEYYLTMLCLERLQYSLAWTHFHSLQSILQEKAHTPPLLLSVKQGLSELCPSP